VIARTIARNGEAVPLRKTDGKPLWME